MLALQFVNPGGIMFIQSATFMYPVPVSMSFAHGGVVAAAEYRVFVATNSNTMAFIVSKVGDSLDGLPAYPSIARDTDNDIAFARPRGIVVMALNCTCLHRRSARTVPESAK